MVVRPSGRVAAMTEGNQQAAAAGEVSIGGEPSLYNRFGGWFAIAVPLAAGMLLVYAPGASRRGG
jgi:apolipoprotein N-acyltransferase